MSRLLSLLLLLTPTLALAQDTLDQGVAGDLDLNLEVDNLNQGVTGMEFLPDGRLVIIEQSGRVSVWDGTNRTTVGNIATQAGGERGLLGLAVDPMFAATNRLYFYYSAGGNQRVSYTTLNGNVLDDGNLNILATNLSHNRNHDGGGIRFGPDGHLYIGVGDTGCNCGCPPGTNTDNYFPTCLTKAHGKILRIDREGGIPATNPLVGIAQVPACGGAEGENSCFSDAPVFPSNTGAPREDIFLWGFRNPWRFEFDSQTNLLWIGDVGEGTFEEITISAQGGEHHGWPFREGADGQAVAECQTVVPQSVGPCKEPAFTYPHTETPAAGQASVTGGVFSNHCSWPAPYSGLYWFGDYNKTRIWTLEPTAARDDVVAGSRQIIVRSANGPVHFEDAPDGSIWYATINDGQIWSIRPQNPVPCDMDAGVDAGVDAGPPDTGDNDTGVVMDTGPMPDTGAPQDAQVPPDDGGPTVDSGDPQKDAGRIDTGPIVGGRRDDDGCGCTAQRSDPSGLGLWSLLGLALLVRRRRRQG